MAELSRRVIVWAMDERKPTKEHSNHEANRFFCAWRQSPWNSENPRAARLLRFASSAKSAASRAVFSLSADCS